MLSVISVLGGEKELGQKVKRRIDFDALIRKGIPWGVISHIKKEFNLPDEVIATIIGVSCRTVARRRKSGRVPVKSPRVVVSRKPDKKGKANLMESKTPSGARLSPVESDRVYRFARIIALAEDVFEDKDEAIEWLKSPQHGLGGLIPFDMLQTDAGAREVEELLIRIDYGIIS